MNFLPSSFSTFPLIPIFLTIVILIYWLHAFFIIYHLVRFGIGVKPKIYALIFFLGSMLLFMIAMFMYGQIDFSTLSFKFNWQMPIFNFPTPTF